MATNSDAEKLRKQIDVLSNLIHTHKELKKKDYSTKDKQNSVNYSWRKDDSKSQRKTSSRNVLRHDKNYSGTSFTLDRRKKGKTDGLDFQKPLLKEFPRTKSSEISEKNDLSSKNLQTSLSSSKSRVLNKPVLTNDNKEKTVPLKIVDKSDNKPEGIKKSGSVLVTSHPGKDPRSLAASTSLLSARLSSLSSSIAAAKSKMNLKTGVGNGIVSKEMTKLPLTTANSSSKLLTKSWSSLSSSVNVKDKIDQESSLSSSYSWNKSQLAEPRASNSQTSTGDKKSKYATSLLKWTKPGSAKNLSVLQKNSKKPTNKTRSSQVKFSDGSTHVWRSRQSLKLDRRKRNSIAMESKKPSTLKGFLRRRQKVVLKDIPKKTVISRYQLINSKRKSPIKAEKSNKVVVIEGIPYKSSANKLQKTSQEKTTINVKKAKQRSSLNINIRGENFLMDPSGKTLTRIDSGKIPTTAKDHEMRSSVASSCSLDTKATKGKHGKRRSSLRRISIGGVTFVETAPGVLVRSIDSVNKKIASRVVRRSVQNALHYKYKRNAKTKPKSEQYCMFYNRFGKCNKGLKCPYIHDPTKIAVCTKFLQGKCKKTDGSCSFSHQIDKDKMPVCQFFLKGMCTNDDCPYSHVNVSSKAAVCQDFIKGYCRNGQQCKKKHILDCEEFSLTGKCSKGKNCNLIHRERGAKKRRRKSSASKETKPTAKRPALEQMTEEDGFLLLEQVDESTEKDSSDSKDVTYKPQEPIAIKPRFLISKDKEG